MQNACLCLIFWIGDRKKKVCVIHEASEKIIFLQVDEQAIV
jgi:hypothetical protein